jgi:hypothetical protein
MSGAAVGAPLSIATRSTFVRIAALPSNTIDASASS